MKERDTISSKISEREGGEASNIVRFRSFHKDHQATQKTPSNTRLTFEKNRTLENHAFQSEKEDHGCQSRVHQRQTRRITAVFVDGVIYFPAYDDVILVDGVRSNLVISFDLKSEKFGEVCLPERLVHTPHLNATKVNESLGLLEYHDEGGMKVCGVWSRTNGANNQFTKIYTIKVEAKWYNRVLGFRNNGEVVMELDGDNYKESRIEVFEPLSGHTNGVGINGKAYTFSARSDMTKNSGDSSKKEFSTTSTPQFQCPMLKPSNYSLWAIRMQIILKANGLWETIEPNEKTQADNRKDKTAIVFLYQALPEDQLLQITKHKTAKSIWDAPKSRHIGEEIVQQARLQTLKSDFEMLHMKEDETIDIFTTKLTTLVNKAASLGHTMEDGTLVRKLLNAVPDRYLQIVMSIEQYSDLSEMTLEEAIGRLKTYEESIKYKKGKQDWKDYMSEHINDEPGWTDFKIGNLEVTNEHHDQGFQPIKEDNEFPNNDNDDYASPTRDSPTHSQTPHTSSTRSSEVNSQVTPNISTQSNYQSDNVSIQTTHSPSHYDHTPVRGFRALNDLYENTEELLLAEDEPKNYKEASSD
nr:zinc finger, CCHC-type [Tanacetum cinerariifolium]